jgi:hypothetical protein
MLRRAGGRRLRSRRIAFWRFIKSFPSCSRFPFVRSRRRPLECAVLAAAVTGNVTGSFPGNLAAEAHLRPMNTTVRQRILGGPASSRARSPRFLPNRPGDEDRAPSPRNETCPDLLIYLVAILGSNSDLFRVRFARDGRVRLLRGQPCHWRFRWFAPVWWVAVLLCCIRRCDNGSRHAFAGQPTSVWQRALDIGPAVHHQPGGVAPVPDAVLCMRNETCTWPPLTGQDVILRDSGVRSRSSLPEQIWHFVASVSGVAPACASSFGPHWRLCHNCWRRP